MSFYIVYVVTHTCSIVNRDFGTLGKSAMALLNKLAEYAAAGGVDFKDGFVVNALRVLSAGLCRGNCVLYKQSPHSLARVSGNAFRAGAGISTSRKY